MTNTKLFMNWTGVTFTPTSGTLLNYTRVTSVSIDSGGSLAPFSGDGDRYNTTVVNDFNEPTASVQCGDLAAVRMYAPGTVGVFTATHNDAKNLAVTGSFAITYSLANAIVSTNPISGAHRQYGQGTVTFMTASADGITNPLTQTVL